MSNFEMEKTSYPVTPAVRLLRAKRVAFEPHLYAWEEHGGTTRAAAELGVEEHGVVKTLVFETDAGKPLLVLMHGDCEVSAKQLARALDVKSVSPCEVSKAQKLTGYMVGGISPFGTRSELPVCAEATIFALPKIYLNGGKRGFLISLNPQDLRLIVPIREVQVGICGGASAGS
ncbi:MAG TPA: aminoacyl-tRNA deacylase [Pyrinomonadaceae bacterium]